MEEGPGLNGVASGVSERREDCTVEEVTNETTGGGGGASGEDESEGSSGDGSGVTAGIGDLPQCGCVVM